MTYRTDKFAVGDKVVWSKSHRDQAHWIVDEETWSEGPFTVVVVIDRPYDPPNDEFKQLNYDDIYHNFLIVTTKDGQKYRVEKNAVVEINKNYGEKNFYDVHEVPINVGEGYTLNRLIENFKNKTPNAWEYNADRNNCQDFVKNVLTSNDIQFGNEENKQIINPQDSRDLIEHSGLLKNIHKKVTDLGAVADIVIHGNSVRKHKK